MILSKMLPKFGCNRIHPLVWSAGVALTAVGAVYIYQWYCRPTPEEGMKITVSNMCFFSCKLMIYRSYDLGNIQFITLTNPQQESIYFLEGIGY